MKRFNDYQLEREVFQQRNPFLPPSLGMEAAYFVIAILPSMLTLHIPLHQDIPGVLGHPG